MTSREREQAAWPSRLRWTLVTSAGWFAGFFGGFVLAGAFEPILGTGPLQSTAGYAFLGLCLGAGVGLMQWLVLRKCIAATSWWVLAGAIGMSVAGGAGYGVAVLIFGYSEGLEDLGSGAAVVGWALAAAFGGAVTGLLQRGALSRHLRRPGRWVPASAVGWALSIAAFGSMGVLGTHLVAEGAPVGAGWFFAGLIAGGLVLGVVTGAALARLSSPPAGQARQT
jgi:hypothetical protein